MSKPTLPLTNLTSPTMPATAEREPIFEADRVRIHCENALEWLPSVSESFDLVVTDPPYMLGLSSTRKRKGAGWGDVTNSSVFYAQWLRQCKRLTAMRQGATWVFSCWRSFSALARAAMQVDFQIESVLVWDKDWIAPGGSNRGLRPSYELVVLLAHEGFQIKDRSLPDIWQEKWSGHKPHGHPAEKPVALLERIIDVSADGKVLDPFMGSGSTLVAARKRGCEVVGVELDQHWIDVAQGRLRQGRLF